IGGLTSALLLRTLGFDVDVFERTPTPLDNRGGGIVLQPITMKGFDGHSARRIDELSVTSHWLRYLGAADDVLYEGSFEWRSTSWG
ncbi:monooxygenase, partial [Mycobacterium sp. ITM-2017-0098]